MTNFLRNILTNHYLLLEALEEWLDLIIIHIYITKRWKNEISPPQNVF